MKTESNPVLDQGKIEFNPVTSFMVNESRPHSHTYTATTMQ